MFFLCFAGTPVDGSTKKVAKFAPTGDFRITSPRFSPKRLRIGTKEWMEVLDTSKTPDETKIAYFVNGQRELHVLSGF